MKKLQKKSLFGIAFLGFISVFLILSCMREVTGRGYFPRPIGKFAIGTVSDGWGYFVPDRENPRRKIRRRLLVQIWYPTVGNLPEKPLFPVPSSYKAMLIKDLGLDISEEEMEREIESDIEENMADYKDADVAKLLRGVKKLGGMIGVVDTDLHKKSKDWLKSRLRELLTMLLGESKKELLKKKNIFKDGKIFDDILASYARKGDLKDIKFPGGKEKFPVIIFSHGKGMGRNFYSAFCENLASHGYVVVSADHTGVASRTEFGENDFIDEDDAGYEENFLGYLKKTTSLYVSDINFIINKIIELHAKKVFFKGRLDLSRIGVFGHSMGGRAALGLSAAGSGISAGVSLDGTLFFKEDTVGVKVPFMFMQASKHLDDEEDEAREMGLSKGEIERAPVLLCSDTAKKGVDAYWLEIEKTRHNDFSDHAILRDILKNMTGYVEENLGVGDGNAFLVTKKINNYLLAFFNKYLKGLDSEVLIGVDFKSFV